MKQTLPQEKYPVLGAEIGLEAPMKPANEAMEAWVKDLRKS